MNKFRMYIQLENFNIIPCPRKGTEIFLQIWKILVLDERVHYFYFKNEQEK